MVGLLAEECQEASNKVVKFTREHLARKFSQAITNDDVMRRMLTPSSHPNFTGTKKRELPVQAQQLLN